MLAPNGGGLILYQACGRKAHLLEDKRIPSVGVFDEVSFYTLFQEEIHVTWAHLEKKQTRLRTCTKIHQEVLFSERGHGVVGIKRRCCDLSGDGVWILATTSQRLRKPAFVCIAVDTSGETRVRRKDTIRDEGEVKEMQSRCIPYRSVSLMSRESTILLVCSAGRMIGF
ncbi:hypothetical protein Tco_0897210 [Tanacetum coccineum]